MFKKKLTEVAIDTFTEYLQERFEKLKQFDLDQDGQKDVDQIIEILGRCSVKAKATLDSTNFSNIAAGLEQVINGASLIKNSLDRETLSELGEELSIASKKLTVLGKLSIQYMKEKGQEPESP